MNLEFNLGLTRFAPEWTHQINMKVYGRLAAALGVDSWVHPGGRSSIQDAMDFTLHAQMDLLLSENIVAKFPEELRVAFNEHLETLVQTLNCRNNRIFWVTLTESPPAPADYSWAKPFMVPTAWDKVVLDAAAKGIGVPEEFIKPPEGTLIQVKSRQPGKSMDIADAIRYCSW